MKISPVITNISKINGFNTASQPIGPSGRFFGALTNLKPLERDTVSFSYSSAPGENKSAISFGGPKPIESGDMAYAPNMNVAKLLYKEASYAADDLKRILDEAIPQKLVKPNFLDKVLGTDPVITRKIRIKKPNSIREKVSSKYIDFLKEGRKAYKNALISQIDKYYNYDKDTVLSLLNTTLDRHFEEFYPNIDDTSYFIETKTLITGIIDRIEKQDYIDSRKPFSEIEGMPKTKFTPEEVREIIIDRIVEYIENDRELDKYKNKPNSLTKEGAKKLAYDIVGGKIVINKDVKANIETIINNMVEQVEAGKLKIVSIENIFPDTPDGEKYAYATKESLLRLANAEYIPENQRISDKKKKKMSKTQAGKPVILQESPKYKPKRSKSGYMAIHINVDLSQEEYKDCYNNYGGEIQIIGKNVNKLKKVEDLCYKLKDNKPAINPKYFVFKKYFNKYYPEFLNSGNRKEQKDLFDRYTLELYKKQRLAKSENSNDDFISIEQAGFEGKIPPELDFNRLYKIFETSLDLADALEEEKENEEAITTLLLNLIKYLPEEDFRQMQEKSWSSVETELTKVLKESDKQIDDPKKYMQKYMDKLLEAYPPAKPSVGKTEAEAGDDSEKAKSKPEKKTEAEAKPKIEEKTKTAGKSKTQPSVKSDKKDFPEETISENMQICFDETDKINCETKKD